MSTTVPASPPGPFERWGRFVARRKWYVLGAWVAALGTIVVLAATAGGSFATGFSLPGSETQKALDLLEERFPAQSLSEATIVFQAEGGLTGGAARSEVERVVAEARSLPGVSAVASPFEAPGQVNEAGTAAFATVLYEENPELIPAGDVEQLFALVDSAATGELQVEVGGEVVQQQEFGGPGPAELVGVGAAAIILFIAFGSLVAMGLPITTALFGLGGAIGLTTLLARFLDVPEFTTAFVAMIGIGVGIDYALLVVTRFREGIHRGDSTPDAVATAVNTAGRSVVFAGTAVVIALMGLVLIGVPFISALGITAAIVVGIAVVVATTLLPALLAILGKRVDAIGVPMLRTQAHRYEDSIFYKLSQRIQRRPVIFLVAAVGVLLALAAPFLDIDSAFTDAGNGPEEYRSRQAYDLLAEGFGPGHNGPLVLVGDAAERPSEEEVEALIEAIDSTPNVASVGTPAFNENGDAFVVRVLPGSAPQDGATAELVETLRGEVLPGFESDSLDIYVSGSTAVVVDLADVINGRTPFFFLVVIGLSLLLLLLAFRSVVIPATAAVMNLLSVGAAYGILVAVFQWGWGASLLNVEQTGPIEPFLPMMLFAILFGLSMDYEVFLVSRIQEEYKRTRNNSAAIARGLGSTGRLITSAALIMICVFLAFLLEDDRAIKEFGLGLAVAIFLDASIVRIFLVPAVMEIAGDWNWWLPGWLDRIVPRVNVEIPEQEAENGEAPGSRRVPVADPAGGK